MESICLHAGGVSAGDQRAEELRPHLADTRYVVQDMRRMYGVC